MFLLVNGYLVIPVCQSRTAKNYAGNGTRHRFLRNSRRRTTKQRGRRRQAVSPPSINASSFHHELFRALENVLQCTPDPSTSRSKTRGLQVCRDDCNRVCFRKTEDNVTNETYIDQAQTQKRRYVFDGWFNFRYYRHFFVPKTRESGNDKKWDLFSDNQNSTRAGRARRNSHRAHAHFLREPRTPACSEVRRYGGRQFTLRF